MDGSGLWATGLWMAGALALLAPNTGAADFVDFNKSDPEVHFDLPRAVAVREVDGAEGVAPLAAGERLVTVELPVSMLVRKGDVGRVGEVTIEVDAAAAGLTVHDYSPATRLESEFTRDIEVDRTTENERHVEASLGGRLPIGGAVAQITPGVSLGRQQQEVETERLARRPPKQAIVVSGPINQRRGVLFKFRPSSQTTLEGERPLRLTFVAPADWQGGHVDVRCHATGERKVLFVKKRATWGHEAACVALRPLGGAPAEADRLVRHTTAKPAIDDGPAAAGPLLWKPRKQAEPPSGHSSN